MTINRMQKIKKGKEKSDNSLLELRLKSYEQSIADLKVSYEEIRKLKHDMNHCIQCIYTLVYNNKLDEAKEYLSQLVSDKFISSTMLVTTKSEVVNAVLNSKFLQCKQNHIDLRYEITGSVENINDIDISILLGNLLDNAIEACMKLNENRRIDLKIFNEKNYLVLIINNRINNSVLKKNPLLKTSKKDKILHGMGISSIKDIVKAYNGIIQIFEENNLFYVDVWLNISEV